MMESKNFIRNIEFTTSSADYELLQDTNVKTAIKERLGFTTDEEYNKYIEGNHLNMYFELFFGGKQSVSVNGSYYYPTMEGDLYYSGNFINPLQSIKIKNNGVSGMICFKIA